ncbi:MAG TPA: single-stranded DNA-binding protein [Dissulfurispiraceae bacterium]|nr:single-stranded DNA-binding protein [Dissulfurispiraceae bacterium]
MNLCIFSGRITRDAETKQIRDDLSITSFSIAVDSGYGERKRTDFINVKAFKKDALAPHLLKGKAVAVHGEYQEEKWEKDGEKKSRVVILANHIEFQQGGNVGAAQQAASSGHEKYLGGGMDDAPFMRMVEY